MTRTGGPPPLPPGTPLSAIAGVRPPNGLATHRIVYVNGILNNPEDAYSSLQAIAADAGAEVVWIYNASEGFFKDMWQSGLDKMDLGKNAAVDTLADTVVQELTSGSRTINLMAHSQGAVITSRALGDVKEMLGEQGFDDQEVKHMMSRVHVETFGGASWTYPDGPQYRHHVNVLDYIPMFTGLWLPGLQGGEGAEKHRFISTEANLHSFDAVYLPMWDSPFQKGAPQGPPG